MDVGVLLYPKRHPRRKELLAELKIVPRRERPFWVAEALVAAIFEGVQLRYALQFGRWRPIEASIRQVLQRLSAATLDAPWNC
jgi:hypothetical protein